MGSVRTVACGGVQHVTGGGQDWVSLPGWELASNNGQSQVGSSIVDLRWSEAEWLVLHNAVGKEAGVDTAVPAVNLLWDSVACAALQGPGLSISAVEDPYVFVSEEPQSREGVFPAIFSNPVLRYEGVEVCDGVVGEVNCNAGPGGPVPIKGHDETVIRQGGTMVELVTPPVEPCFG